LNDARLIHLVAHRGNAREFPENTLPAFQSALDLGVRFLELDVHLCADGTPVVIHDHLLARTTGLPGSIFELTGAQAAAIEAAEPARFGDRYRGTRIPLLTDALALLDGRWNHAFVETARPRCQSRHRQRVVETLRPWRSQCMSLWPAAVHRAPSSRGADRLCCGVRPAPRAQYEALLPELFSPRIAPARGLRGAGPGAGPSTRSRRSSGSS
jgi:hypothetical protein